MGDLPSPRVNPSRSFLSVGIDYCGPFNARAVNIRSSRIFKIYIRNFIWFSTKAVHLEVSTDLSTHAFIAALSLLQPEEAQVYSVCG